ncbi:MAG TPA: rhombosortase, partial [Alcanivorax sp.]|nr:rhombosortase [Alcanivorax sp.]
HLVHLNLWHALLNLGGLVLILFFFRDLLDRRRFWLWFAVSAPLVGAVLFVLDRDLGWYVGLSGLLQGL